MSVTTFGTLSLEDTFAAGEGDRRRARIRREPCTGSPSISMPGTVVLPSP